MKEKRTLTLSLDKDVVDFMKQRNIEMTRIVEAVLENQGWMLNATNKKYAGKKNVTVKVSKAAYDNAKKLDNISRTMSEVLREILCVE